MSWHPNDVVSDLDLQAYEQTVLSAFGQVDWAEKRRKAIEDWLFPRLTAAGFDPYKLRTRYQPDLVQGYTASAYSDKLGAATSTDTDDINLATVFATVGTDALFVGSTRPFRGLSVRQLDAVNTAASVLTVSYWADGWLALPLSDGTQKTAGKAFSGGGAVTWRLPIDWTPRSLNGSDRLYLVKLTMSATPTAAKCGQIGVIRRSCLCAPATFRTLTLIMREAPTKATGGPWDAKAEWYEQQASDALQLALEAVGGEIDTDASDQIDSTEAVQTAATAGGGPFHLERA